MKAGFIIWIAGFFCVHDCNAQIHAFQLSLIDSNEAILYVGVDNVVSFVHLPAGATIHFTGLSRKQPGNLSMYYLRSSQAGKNDTLTILRGRTTLYQKIYETRLIPDPVLKFGILPGRTGTVNQIMAMPVLRVVSEGSRLKRFAARVTSYGLTITHRREIVFQTTDRYGDKLLPNELTAIQGLRAGDTIVFDDIRAIGPDSRLRNFGSFTLLIR